MLDLTAATIAIAASFVAAVLAATTDVPGWITAAIAALPGLAASLQRVIDFRSRAAWCFTKSAKLYALLT